MKNTQRLSLGALLLAVMLVLGYLESLIPLTGMPGVKPGLSNCVLMLSLGWLGGGMTLALMAGKVLLSGLLFGSPFSMLYALAGGLCSLGFDDGASKNSRNQLFRHGAWRAARPTIWRRCCWPC